jgi:capsule polysaccharide export protein KpsE/RkpR
VDGIGFYKVTFPCMLLYKYKETAFFTDFFRCSLFFLLFFYFFFFFFFFFLSKTYFPLSTLHIRAAKEAKEALQTGVWELLTGLLFDCLY